MISNVVAYLGGGWIYSKTDFVWNGCDWNYQEMLSNVKYSFEKQLKSSIENESLWYSRRNLRKFLLTRGFSQMLENEPILPPSKVKDYLERTLTFFPYIKDSDGIYRGKLFELRGLARLA